MHRNFGSSFRILVIVFAIIQSHFANANHHHGKKHTIKHHHAQSSTHTAPGEQNSQTPNKPHTLKDELILKATNTLNLIYQYNPNTIEKQMNSALAFFTEEGKKSFQEAFEESGNISAIKENQISASVHFGKNINFISETYTIQIPFTVEYQAKNQREMKQNLLASIQFVQAQNHQEYQIQNMVIKPQEKAV